MVWRGDNRGRVARSILTLFDQLDRFAPARSTASDGTIGDFAHQQTDSDHNPWYPPPQGGIVTAGDYTHDPAHGISIARLSDELAASRDPRIKYMIANRFILDSRPQFSPWRWVAYSGTDPHINHLHLSVVDSSLCDDPRPWDLPMLGNAPAPPPIPSGDNHGQIPDAVIGQTSEFIRRVQVWANQKFPLYSHLVADGVYGPETAKVLAEFQRRAGIVGGDGRNIGPQTKAAMWRFGFRP